MRPGFRSKGLRGGLIMYPPFQDSHCWGLDGDMWFLGCGEGPSNRLGSPNFPLGSPARDKKGKICGTEEEIRRSKLEDFSETFWIKLCFVFSNNNKVASCKSGA